MVNNHNGLVYDHARRGAASPEQHRGAFCDGCWVHQTPIRGIMRIDSRSSHSRTYEMHAQQNNSTKVIASDLDLIVL